MTEKESGMSAGVLPEGDRFSRTVRPFIPVAFGRETIGIDRGAIGKNLD